MIQLQNACLVKELPFQKKHFADIMPQFWSFLELECNSMKSSLVFIEIIIPHYIKRVIPKMTKKTGHCNKKMIHEYP